MANKSRLRRFEVMDEGIDWEHDRKDKEYVFPELRQSHAREADGHSRLPEKPRVGRGAGSMFVKSRESIKQDHSVLDRSAGDIPISKFNIQKPAPTRAFSRYERGKVAPPQSRDSVSSRSRSNWVRKAWRPVGK